MTISVPSFSPAPSGSPSITPLMTRPFLNRPSADGICIRSITFIPPPDWPKMVTFSGSPPNRAILSCTHCRAATISAWPAFAEFLYFSPNGDRSRYPKIFSLWLTETRIESPFFAMLTPSYATCSMEDPAAYPPPWNHTRTGFLASGSSLFVQIFKDWQCSSCGQ